MPTPWLTFEHSARAYRADFVFYGLVATGLALALMLGSPRAQAWLLLAWVAAGVASWTLLEYLLHRFVLHGLPPFKAWHAEHHRRPRALIAAPTALTASLFLLGLVWPATVYLGLWPAASLSLGLLSGYLAYGLTHHVLHLPSHRAAGGAAPAGQGWLARRRHWHALHHRAPFSPGRYFGVSGRWWDQVFRSGR